jgi:dTDP-4-dehydrorhamnose reductase
MRVLISGGGGMLARALRQCFAEKCTVLALPRQEMDIARFKDILHILHDFKPELILNPAAFTRVDDNELYPDQAFQVNAVGAANMALAAKQAGAPLVHFSTDYVFEGRQDMPYREGDQVNPLSVYGKSKFAGEMLVRQTWSQHYIIRIAWLFGKGGNNFIDFVRQKLSSKQTVRAAVDQQGTPTFTPDLADAVYALVEKPFYGTYHLTNDGFCSRYQLAREIAWFIGKPVDLVSPIELAELELPAVRPLYTVLDNAYWRERGFTPLRHYSLALREHLKDFN